jgi:hypothetical protein
MPFGRKPIKPGGPDIDFDRIYEAIRRGVEQAQVECRRADYDPSGGFIHRSMFEALIVTEIVIADLTLANPNVTYEIGVRHGAGQRNTLLIWSERFVKQLPFDLGPLRALTYRLDDNLELTQESAAELSENICDRLVSITASRLPEDNPILQVTGLSRNVAHEKTDLFVSQLAYAGTIGEKVRKALNLSDGDAVARLAELQDEVLGEPYVEAQLHSALMAIYLGFREKKAYRKMVDLYARLPKELQNATVVLEQLALAQNRLAERELNQAIEAYEKGLLQDPRDYYPGVNAVTLRLTRGSAEDEARLKRIVPVVRFAIERAAAPAGLAGLLTLNVDQWMHETTAKNLKLQKRARKDETRTVKNLEKYMQALSPQ